MWEAKAAAGRVDELVAHVLSAADPDAQVYRNAARVVVIDPSGRGVAEVPAELVDRPPHSWRFDPVPRAAAPSAPSAPACTCRPGGGR